MKTETTDTRTPARRLADHIVWTASRERTHGEAVRCLSTTDLIRLLQDVIDTARTTQRNGGHREHVCANGHFCPTWLGLARHLSNELHLRHELPHIEVPEESDWARFDELTPGER